MKKCPGCGYLWADDYTGTCVDCGKPLGAIGGSNVGDLGFQFADQTRRAQREGNIEQSLRSAGSPKAQAEVYARAAVPDAVLEVARNLLVQREEVRYEDDGT